MVSVSLPSNIIGQRPHLWTPAAISTRSSAQKRRSVALQTPHSARITVHKVCDGDQIRSGATVRACTQTCTRAGPHARIFCEAQKHHNSERQKTSQQATLISAQSCGCQYHCRNNQITNSQCVSKQQKKQALTTSPTTSSFVGKMKPSI